MTGVASFVGGGGPARAARARTPRRSGLPACAAIAWALGAIAAGAQEPNPRRPDAARPAVDAPPRATSRPGAASRPAPEADAATTRATPPVVAGDFDPEGRRRVVVDRVPGRYLGHPSTALVDGGRGVLCAYPEGHGKGPIVLRRSDDGGRTWGERLPVPANFATSEETPTLFRVADPRTGRDRLVLWSGLKPARRAVSEDEGRTWTPLAPVGAWGGIVLMSAGFADGPRFRAFFHDDGRFFGPRPASPRRFTVYDVATEDGGLTWGEPRPIAAAAGLDLCEPGHVRSPDGALDLLLLRENSRRAPSQRIASADRGRTWGPPVPLPPALTGDRHTARYAADGRLVVVFRDMAEGSATRGDFVAWYGRFEELMAGAGGRRVRLLDNRHAWDCGYAGLELLPDGALLAVTYGHFTAGEAPYVVALRFTPEELDRI